MLRGRVSSTLMTVPLAMSLGPSCLLALNPGKILSQYTRTVWTQAQGLPQDTVRAISQTTDGYLWLGTDEGLARFDGYDFVVFGKRSGELPNNSVTTLMASSNGSLWIGTQNGLVRYAAGQFKTYTTKDGLPPGAVNSLAEDSAGIIWIACGGFLARFENDRFAVYSKDRLGGIEATRSLYYDSRNHQLWIGGVAGVVKKDSGDKFTSVLDAKELDANIITNIVPGRAGVWLGGSRGLFLIAADGNLRRFTKSDGLPSGIIRALWEDRAGNFWAGTLGGLCRFENGRFVSAPSSDNEDQDGVWSLFEDREGDLWVGMNSRLIRFRDDLFSVYGRAEGLPSDEPIVIHQDKRGRIWVGFHDSGLMAFEHGYPSYTTREGLPDNEVFAISEARNGDLLIATWGGLARMHEGRFSKYQVPDPVGRTVVFDAVEDAEGRIWAATANGVYVYENGAWRISIRGGSDSNGYTITLAQGADGSIWAGTLSNGLWKLTDGSSPLAKPRLYNIADGLGSNQIRSLYEDSDGTLWIGTFSGGLNAFRNGKFSRFGETDGLPSDNISYVQEDDRRNLWLSTTRGISRISKKQLSDFSAGRIHLLTPEDYGIADGLRSTECAPAYPAGGGGTRTSDGRLWFPTARGLAIIDPNVEVAAAPQSAYTPITHIIEVTVDGRSIDFSRAARLKPGPGRVQFRYAGTYLSAPERVHYFYKLEGLDPGWIAAGSRRLINYNPLPHGNYEFVVRSSLPGGGSSESRFHFEVQPFFYQTSWFRLLSGSALAAIIYGIFYLRLKKVRSRFALVFEERARVAREIHDTLAQGFVGISAQLDALAIKLNGDIDVAKQHLDLARKMARFSLTEARRSVMDLRTSELQGQGLPAAVEVSARRLVAGTKVELSCDFGDLKQELAPHVEQNILRIAQEALANAVKHAQPSLIEVQLKRENGLVCLRVKDDGRGFGSPDTPSVQEGHFGIMGMQERAERSGGQFSLTSVLGSGTLVEVKIPVCVQKARP